MHQRQDEVALLGFMREAQLDHSYAAHVYACRVEDEDGILWIAMELVQGITLKRWLQTHGPMPLNQFVPFFEYIAQVVQTAHDREIVHRNLKPSNVMVIESAGRLFPKLLNFGMDRLTRSDARKSSTVYMAPEQWSNALTVGPAADTYALGVVAYEALTGHVPFIAKTRDEYGQRQRDAPVPPLGGDFPPDLDRILQRALAKNPEDRHGNVLELASELRAALRTSPGEQLRSSAQECDDRGRPPGLLWGADMLADLARRTRARLSGREGAFIGEPVARSAFRLGPTLACGNRRDDPVWRGGVSRKDRRLVWLNSVPR